MKSKGKIYLYITILVCMVLLCLILVACKTTSVGGDDFTQENGDAQKPVEKPKPDDPSFADSLTIYYDDMGDATAIEYTQDIITLLIPKQRKGYTFLYWLSEDGNSIPKGIIYNSSTVESIRLTAAWKVSEYTLTLKYDDGTGNVTDQKFNVDSEKILLPDPTRLGYDFLGWYYGDNKVPIKEIPRGTIGDLALSAKWKTQTYTIAYRNVNSDFDSEAKYNINTDDFTLPIPTKDRCRFLGWYKYNNLSGERIYSVAKGSSGNLELYAKWSAAEYRVDYELHGGSAEGLFTSYSRDTQSINLDRHIPTRVGYKFIGWYQHPDCADTSIIKSISYTDTKDYKLFASWTSDNATSNVEYSQLKCLAPNSESLNQRDHVGCHYTTIGVAAGAGNVYNIANIYKSLPVKAIDRLAFQTLKNSIINVPSNVTAIGDEAFRDCSEGTIVNLPTTLKTIGRRSFYKCVKLSAIIPASIGNNLGDECFAYSKNCSFTISEGVTSLPYQAFFSATVSKIVLPISIESIGDNAFAGISAGATESGTLIKLGGKINYWGGGLFANSKIAKLSIDRAQSTITYASLFDLYNISTDYFTKISMSLSLINNIASDIYFRIMGFYNPAFRVKFDCSTVNENISLLGHYSSNEITHSLEEVCVSKISDNDTDGIKNNYILDLKSINTIVHETRHYFQNLCFKKKIKNVSSTKIPYVLMPSDSEIATWNPAFYISATDAPERYPDYYHQAVEEDARRAATEITGYLPKHTPCIKCPKIA